MSVDYHHFLFPVDRTFRADVHDIAVVVRELGARGLLPLWPDETLAHPVPGPAVDLESQCRFSRLPAKGVLRRSGESGDAEPVDAFWSPDSGIDSGSIDWDGCGPPFGGWPFQEGPPAYETLNFVLSIRWSTHWLVPSETILCEDVESRSFKRSFIRFARLLLRRRFQSVRALHCVCGVALREEWGMWHGNVMSSVADTCEGCGRRFDPSAREYLVTHGMSNETFRMQGGCFSRFHLEWTLEPFSRSGSCAALRRDVVSCVESVLGVRFFEFCAYL